jgi:hypothetical protein
MLREMVLPWYDVGTFVQALLRVGYLSGPAMLRRAETHGTRQKVLMADDDFFTLAEAGDNNKGAVRRNVLPFVVSHSKG